MRILFFALAWWMQCTHSALKIDTHIVCIITNDTSKEVQLLAKPKKMVWRAYTDTFVPAKITSYHALASIPAQSSTRIAVKCLDIYTAIDDSRVKVRFTEGTRALIVIDGKQRGSLILQSGKTYSILAHIKPPLYPRSTMAPVTQQ